MGGRLWGMLTALAAAALATAAPSAAAPPAPTLEAFLSYPFVSGLVAAPKGGRIAWIENVAGVRSVWVAAGPGYAPREVARSEGDDGQELTQLGFDPSGERLIWARGGDHDQNWPAEGDLAPDPASATAQPKIEIWTAPAAGGPARKLTEGDEPTVSAKGVVAYVKDHQIWTVALDGGKGAGGKPAKLFFDRGKDRAPAWSPDGARLGFVSERGDHSFVGVFSAAAAPLVYLAPYTARDGDFVWSPDSRRIAFTRQPGDGGAPEPLLRFTPRPFAIWTADAATGEGARAWASPVTLDGSYPYTGDGVGLRWMAGDTLAFLAHLDGWEHLYALPASGGAPRLLTPGRFMVEHVAATLDRRALLYAANTGGGPGDDDRRHVFRVALDGSPSSALSGGVGIEWSPAAAGTGAAAIVADATRPPSVALLGPGARAIHVAVPAYPSAALVTPTLVSFPSADGFTIQGQLFTPPGAPAGKRPAVIFVHGGPSRQMLLGWHYMDYYSNAYAVNQYLASRGLVVLSVNYRLGVGYGRAFEQPEAAGPAGGSEYRDVVAAQRWLARLPGVDGARIGIWGGSYGGYLTGMALSRNSDLFAAGVDLHGVHDWSRILGEEIGAPLKRYEQGDWAEAMKTAFEASPSAQAARWRSPVLLIQGDDDRNVRFNQTVDLAGRLTRSGAPFEELVLPNEIHGFLRHEAWLRADAATGRYLEDKLRP